MPQRYKVITWHGEGRSLFYVVDLLTDPNDATVLSTHDTRPEADNAIRRYEAADYRRERAAVRLGLPEFPRPR